MQWDRHILSLCMIKSSSPEIRNRAYGIPHWDGKKCGWAWLGFLVAFDVLRDRLDFTSVASGDLNWRSYWLGVSCLLWSCCAYINELWHIYCQWLELIDLLAIACFIWLKNIVELKVNLLRSSNCRWCNSILLLSRCRGYPFCWPTQCFFCWLVMFWTIGKGATNALVAWLG